MLSISLIGGARLATGGRQTLNFHIRVCFAGWHVGKCAYLLCGGSRWGSGLFYGRPLSSYSQVIDGTAGAGALHGTPGDDLIRGFAGDDSMWGGEGDDEMYGHDGDVKMVGDAGTDAAFGGIGGDAIWGNDSDDRLYWESGDDTVHGDGGDDRLYGHEGRDQLHDDLGDNGLNGGGDIDSCYDIISANVVFNCEEPGSKDQLGDSVFEDFDIKNYGFDENGETYVEVYGKAGQTLPSGEHTAFAYVIYTDTGVYASDSHEAQHADNEEVANKSWHGHLIVLDSEGCIEEVDGFKSEAHLDGDRVTITDTGADRLLKVQTVRLELQVDDPDNPPLGVTCIARVVEVFDEAVAS